MSKAAKGHVRRGLASTHNEIVILEIQQIYYKIYLKLQ